MKTSIYKIEKTGYGHWKVTIEYRNGKLYSAITTDSLSIDNLFMQTDTKKEVAISKRAEKALIRKVKRENNLK